MRKTGRENGRKNYQRRSGNESSRGKLGEIFEKDMMMRRKGRRRKEGKMRERRKNG